MNKKLSFINQLRNHALVLGLCLAPLGISFAGWEVSWIDRFDGNGVNWNNWTAQIPANYNNEVQCYTDDETSELRNYEVSDGTLKITARRQNIDCPGLNGENREWTSGRLNSKDKGEFLYGRVEARLRFLELKGGTWPAFWMLENRIAEYPIKGDNDNVGWPRPGAGEIDVWEWYANSGDRYITNFFNVESCGSEIRASYAGGAPDVMEFRTYAIEWTADNIKFFMDDEIVAEHDLSNCTQYEEPMFVLLNVAMGGTLGGAIDPTLDKATLEVDYVAHCVATDANELKQCNEQTPLMADEDGDGVSDGNDECSGTPAGTIVNVSGCPVATEPEVPAEPPTLAPANVISLYSDAYSNIASIDYNPNWGQATEVTEIQVDGDNILKYGGLNYQGTDFENNKQDVSNMDFIHINYWTHNATTLQLFLISPGPVEKAFTFDLVTQEWQSNAIPLSAFAGVDLSDVFQLKVEGDGTVYLDNIYFGVGPSINVAPTVTLTAVQDGESIELIDRNGGLVTVSAIITDENGSDTHTIEWRATGLESYTENGAEVTFNPSNLNDSRMQLVAEVTDSGAPGLTATARVNLPMPSPLTTDEPEVAENSSSGGSMGLYLLLGLIGMCVQRRFTRAEY